MARIGDRPNVSLAQRSKNHIKLVKIIWHGVYDKMSAAVPMLSKRIVANSNAEERIKEWIKDPPRTVRK
eukprot:6198342-Pleurochrysis_carterae.AAC.4